MDEGDGEMSSEDFIRREDVLRLSLTVNVPGLSPRAPMLILEAAQAGARATADAFCEYVKKIPAADAVEVVRCGDCAYKEVACGALYCSTWDVWNISEKGFCSFGARKERGK